MRRILQASRGICLRRFALPFVPVLLGAGSLAAQTPAGTQLYQQETAKPSPEPDFLSPPAAPILTDLQRVAARMKQREMMKAASKSTDTKPVDQPHPETPVVSQVRPAVPEKTPQAVLNKAKPEPQHVFARPVPEPVFIPAPNAPLITGLHQPAAPRPQEKISLSAMRFAALPRPAGPAVTRLAPAPIPTHQPVTATIAPKLETPKKPAETAAVRFPQPVVQIPQQASIKPIPKAAASRKAPKPGTKAASQSDPANIHWDGHGLEIEASNASLEQILHQVAALTGAKLDGPIQDQRVFGHFGPGPGCDVLSKLLDGTGNNVLMINSRDACTPLQIFVSARSAESLPPASKDQSRNKVENARQTNPAPPPPDYPVQASSTPPDQNPYANGVKATGDPVQVMQEILDRQQNIDLQQLQEQRQNRQH